jgi:hypothetical protein
MKRLALIAGAGVLALALPLLSACDTISNALAGNAASAVSTSPAQAHTLAAAENAYTAAATAARVYVQSGKASRAVVAQIGQLDNEAYAALVAARQANSRGDSPALAAALEVFNAKYGSLWGFLKGLGLPLSG